MRVMGPMRTYPAPLWIAWAAYCLASTCGMLETYTCFATRVGSISKPPSTFAIFPRKHVLKLDSCDDYISWLEISTASTPCLVHRTAHRAEIPTGSEHGLRNVTALTAEIRLGLQASAISTNPTPGSKMVPPTTCSEKRVAVEGVRTPEKMTF